MNGISSISHSPDTPIRINKTIFALDNISITSLHMRLLISRGRVTHAIVKMKVRVVTVITQNQRSCIGSSVGHNQSRRSSGHLMQRGWRSWRTHGDHGDRGYCGDSGHGRYGYGYDSVRCKENQALKSPFQSNIFGTNFNQIRLPRAWVGSTRGGGWGLATKAALGVGTGALPEGVGAN